MRDEMPPKWVLALAAALGAAAIVIASAYGMSHHPAAYTGAAVALIVLAWGVVRQR